jgi:predicted DNA-binding transcriptional regulator AlpA
MLATTTKIIRAGLEADPTLTPAHRACIMAAIRDSENPAKQPIPVAKQAPRLLRRAEVANRLSCSLRTVDKLPINKVKFPGRQRAAGFLESDVNALMQ